MAKPKNEITSPTEQKLTEQNPTEQNPEDQQPGGQAPEAPGTEQNPKDQQPPAPGDGGTAPCASAAVGQAQKGLLHLHDLAQRHRVATWQQAALARLMGWEEGKQVTDEAYQAALARLHGRRMGGQ